MADILKDELAVDELVWGYNGPGVFNPGPGPMTDQEVADVLNTIHPAPDTRTRDRTSLSASQVYNAIDQANWAALSPAAQQEIWDILHLGNVNPFGREAARFTSIFGAGSDTITALKAARVESITRAQELPGVRSPVKVGHVQVARS